MVERGTRHRPRAASEAADEIERDLDRHLEILAGLIDASGRSRAEIEAALGWPADHLREVLGRRRPLAYDELFAVLEAIGVEPRHYFILFASSDTEH